MRKKLVILTMVALIALVAATPVMAGHGGGHGGGQGGRPLFALVGTITAIGENTITVEVKDGNRFVVPYIGQELTVQVTGSTRFLRWTSDGGVPITFADVEVLDSTNIRGTVTDGIFTADRVIVDVPCQ